jgi:hypothetical protein
MHCYTITWNVAEGRSSAVSNCVRVGLRGDDPERELDVEAFEWPDFGPNRKTIPKVLYADFETTLKQGYTYQVPYCMALVEEYTGRSKFYWGEDCALRFLDDLEEWFETGDNVIVYYHNLGE